MDPAREQRDAQRRADRREWELENFEKYIVETRANPSYQAHERLASILNEAGVDPVILQDAEVTRFVHLMRELLADSRHGESLEQMLRPLQTLMAAADGERGGRPPVERTWEQWRERVQELKRTKATLTARERYEDVAAEWEAAGNKPVKWGAIKDGISELNKRVKNPV